MVQNCNKITNELPNCFDKTTYLWLHKCTKFLYCKFLKSPMATEAWNPAVRARSSCGQKRAKLPNIKLLSQSRIISATLFVMSLSKYESKFECQPLREKHYET